jgi:hypothetical protein
MRAKRIIGEILNYMGIITLGILPVSEDKRDEDYWDNCSSACW